MTDRILDISSDPARLKVRYEQLVIEQEGKPEATVPLNEIAAITVSNPQVSYSHAVLAGMAKNNAALIVCDEKHMPCAMMLPLSGNFVQSERFAAQANAALPVQKRLWQQIITAKVNAQGRLLAEIFGNDRGFFALAKRVRSGDPENFEAQASRRYWPLVFKDEKFKRDREKEDQNRNLNYGYAILRAIVARAICASGLHPSLGVHHHNRYDAFCLADDLMEPYRPLVDRAVAKWVDEHGTAAPMDKEAKKYLLEALTGKVTLEGEERTLFDVAARTASSLVQVYAGKAQKLLIAEV